MNIYTVLDYLQMPFLSGIYPDEVYVLEMDPSRSIWVELAQRIIYSWISRLEFNFSAPQILVYSMDECEWRQTSLKVV